jgi:glycosyltransferase involved in cell wall biosynthesis
MRVLVLTRYSRMGASSRLRSLQYIDVWSTLGTHDFHVHSLLNDAYLQSLYAKRRVSVSAFMRAYGYRMKLLLQARNFDVVWFEKELFPNFPACFEWWLVLSGVPYVVDYDDAIFHNYDLSTNLFKRALKNKIRGVMRCAALVVSGSTYLAQYAIDSGASLVALIPTVVDIHRYPRQAPNVSGDRLVIGWIGSPTTVKFLRPLIPVLAKLAEIFPLELTIVGAELEVYSYGFIHCIAWHEDTEVEEISRFDIGIMPLPDEPWERGKCGYKLIQYMACSKPVVASPVGTNVDIVKHGVNGFFADSEKSWFDALFRLLSDPDLRHSMGQEGRMLVEKKYCLQVTAPKLLDLLRQVVSQNKAIGCVD